MDQFYKDGFSKERIFHGNGSGFGGVFTCTNKISEYTTSDFFKEVARTLKPSGFFLYSDFMSRIHYPKRPLQLEACGLKILSEQEITSQVLKSMDLSRPYKEDLLKKMVPKPFRKSIADFVGLPGSNIYNKFANGEVIYFSFVCSKAN
jgi:hypothetical protein